VSWKSPLWAVVLGALLIPDIRAFPAQAWQRQAQARADELRAKNGNGTDERLTKQLLSMEDEDQGARGMRAVPPNPDLTLDDDELAKVDSQITAKLKQIVAEHGWPTIALVGTQASQAAVVILVHSPDHAWQEQLLPELQRLVEQDKIFGSDVATLTDRILVSAGKRQRFGTQFKTQEREIVIVEVEDPGHLDDRRARYLLPPMDVQRKIIESMYHLPVK
jgi:hypothetical protein